MCNLLSFVLDRWRRTRCLLEYIRLVLMDQHLSLIHMFPQCFLVANSKWQDLVELREWRQLMEASSVKLLHHFEKQPKRNLLATTIISQELKHIRMKLTRLCLNNSLAKEKLSDAFSRRFFNSILNKKH